MLVAYSIVPSLKFVANIFVSLRGPTKEGRGNLEERGVHPSRLPRKYRVDGDYVAEGLDAA